MAQSGPGPKKSNTLWIVLLGALIILVLGWIIFTAAGPDGTPGEPDNAEIAAPAAGEGVDVTLPDTPVEDLGGQ